MSRTVLYGSITWPRETWSRCWWDGVTIQMETMPFVRYTRGGGSVEYCIAGPYSDGVIVVLDHPYYQRVSPEEASATIDAVLRWKSAGEPVRWHYGAGA